MAGKLVTELSASERQFVDIGNLRLLQTLGGLPNLSSFSIVGSLLSAGQAAGWISITDVAVSGGTASNKTWDDPPGNTVLQAVTVSALSLLVSVKASAPRVIVGGAAATLGQHVSGGYYLGTVPVTATEGALIAQVTTPDVPR